MAAEYKDVTLKRFDGTDIDVLLPTTHMGQIYTDNTLTTTIGTYLTNTFIPLTQKGAPNGVAILDGTGKVEAGQLPSYVTGGMKFIAAVSFSGGKTVDAIITALSTNTYVGSYVIATATGDLTQGTLWTGTVQAPGDEGDSTLPVTVEAGDWVVVTAIDLDLLTVTFAIVNNTYSAATSSASGIVTLSDGNGGVTTGMTGDTVITEGIVASLIGTAAGKIAAGDHTHDSRYYTETEVQNFFSGATGISGYNKTNWDAVYGTVNTYESSWNAAYTWTNSANTNITNKVLSATDGIIVYGASPTSTVTGAILIDED